MDRLGGKVVDPDERVRSPAGDEGEPPAIGREPEVAEGAAPVDELPGLGPRLDPDAEDAAPAEEQHGGAVGGEERGGGGFGQLPRGLAVLDHPERLFDARRDRWSGSGARRRGWGRRPG